MTYRIRGKRVLLDGDFRESCIYFENGKITRIGGEHSFDEEFDAGENYIIPGLFDIHTHGAVDVDFSEGDEEGVLRAARYHLLHGATSIMPTVTSSTPEQTYRALEVLERVMASHTGHNIIGVHLEGPYFSPVQAGGQAREMLSDPKKEDYERIVERFGHIIRRWDYAPERDADGTFAAYLTANGILASAGHTDAKYDDMTRAMANGCRLITHFYSCTSTVTREGGYRKLGVIECGYLFDDLYIEIIADGSHLPRELLRLIFKLKPHDKIILVSDSLKVAGCDAKYSSVGKTPCIIEDGVCKLLDRSAFAGSIASSDVCLCKAVELGGLPLSEAVRMGSEVPATLFGEHKGRIKEGYDADFVMLSPDLSVKQVWLLGRAQI